MKSKLFIIGYLVICIYIFFNRFDSWKNTTFFWDKMGYHAYLPATFIYHSVDKMVFYPEIAHKYHWANDIKDYALYKQPNGRMLNKYPVGYAIMEMPFFLMAQAYTINTNKAEADGFSIAYQVCNAFATLFWTAIGLILLRNFLQKRFSDGITTITLLCITLGTNLYYYTVFDHGMSHPFSFTAFALLLYTTDRFYETNKFSFLYGIAFSLGLIFILRQVNILVFIFPLLWGVYDMHSLKERIGLIKKSYLHLAIAVIVFAAVIFIQLLYWKYITGHWFYYSYHGEGFDFLRIRVLHGLFSYQKGWFLYTPLALIAISGITFLKKEYRLTFAIYFTLAVYITFSWKEWWYGGSFGCRALIETYAFLSFPLAAIIEYISRKYKSIKIAGWVVILLCIALNVFQTYQFSHGLIHYDSMTAKRYWKIFGKTTVSENLDQYNLPWQYINKEKELP